MLEPVYGTLQPENTTTAMVGPSGSGKSTLCPVPSPRRPIKWAWK